MLKQIFQSVPIPYRTTDPPGGGFFGASYPANGVPPYKESIAWVSAMWIAPYTTLTSQASIYVLAVLNTVYWPSWAIGMYRFDANTGQLVESYEPVSAIWAIELQNATVARSGKLFFTNLYHTDLIEFVMGKTETATLGHGPSTPERFSFVNGFTHDHFDDLIGFSVFGIDDMPSAGSPQGRFLHASGWDIQVFEWTTGKWLYDIQMPDLVAAICMEDANHAYILLNNRMLILFDYTRGEVMGATKVPPLGTEAGLWNNTGYRMSWDVLFRRLLICETLQDRADGTAQTCVRGYRPVPMPVRMTLPIPLKVPRRFRTIPVLTQIVGDMNEGAGGGATMTSRVTGSGSKIGIPMTDFRNDVITQVACEGNRLYYPSPFDDEYFYTGSPGAAPPHMGLIDMLCTARIYQPDEGFPTSGTPPPLPTPGNPPGEPSPYGPGLPFESPDMMGVMQSVLARGHWDISGDNSLNPTGRGGFTEAAVQAMHDIDARFGHVDKGSGTGDSPNRYNGHAVDAVCFKNDDGITGEIIDIFIGSAEGALCWRRDSRDTHGKDVWKWPA